MCGSCGTSERPTHRWRSCLFDGARGSFEPQPRNCAGPLNGLDRARSPLAREAKLSACGQRVRPRRHATWHRVRRRRVAGVRRCWSILHERPQGRLRLDGLCRGAEWFAAARLCAAQGAAWRPGLLLSPIGAARMVATYVSGERASDRGAPSVAGGRIAWYTLSSFRLRGAPECQVLMRFAGSRAGRLERLREALFLPQPRLGRLLMGRRS